MKNPMLASTPHTYLMHCPQRMQDKMMHEIGNGKSYSLCRFGPAVVLDPADCDLLKVASILVNLEDCSSTLFLSRTCPLKIFFMPFHMVHMKARKSVGGSCLQNWGSSISSKLSSESTSTGSFSGCAIGVHSACKQPLYELVGLSIVTGTRSNVLKTSSDIKFLHRRVINIAWECFAPRVREELSIMARKMALFKQTVWLCVIKSWITCNTGLLKDDWCSSPKILRWTQRPMQ